MMFSLNMADPSFQCQPHAPSVIELFETWLELGLGGLGSKCLGPGLANIF